ncbi:hypothetical protein D9758_007418 [Tetrapyrgos nigripes]|uniref:Uncharacterized protein n=1 Tax=Tetrapyrgos nigripes TaxID=182062 RepID=A0A8H5G3E4_9AGAR|nr:hypothetical protein D9758_007418 [Tetrapyrgos nigripes]
MLKGHYTLAIGFMSEETVAQGNSTVAHGQIYVEHLVLERILHETLIIMIHDPGMTGTNFLNAPDGRLGWADYFLSEGLSASSSSVAWADSVTYLRSTEQFIVSKPSELQPAGTLTSILFFLLFSPSSLRLFQACIPFAHASLSLSEPSFLFLKRSGLLLPLLLRQSALIMFLFPFPFPPNAFTGHPNQAWDDSARTSPPRRETTSSFNSNKSNASTSVHQAVAWIADPSLQEVLPRMDLVMRAHTFLHDNSARRKEVVSRQRMVQCLREVEDSLCVLSLLYQPSRVGCHVKRWYQSHLHKKKLERLEKAINVYLDCLDASSFVLPSSPDSDHGNPETATSSDRPAYPTSSDWNCSELTIRCDDLPSFDQVRDQAHSIDEMGAASSRDSGIQGVDSRNAFPTLPFKFSPCHEECLAARMPVAWIETIMNRMKEERSPYQYLTRDGRSPKSGHGAPSSSRSRSWRRWKKTPSEKGLVSSSHSAAD